ncbi:glyoxalase superfamily protein [uncultured Devosia sp.]|uniref:glyoxalase superfamily protein n=1 Tax=uncultured Devosia sp. TaxID=211434 RepID=UPI0035CB3BEF
MSFSLDTPSAQTLKSEARALRDDRAKAGETLSQGAALEAVARAHGFRDWNTARASLPERVAVPFQLGMRVTGKYLSRPFRGLLIAVSVMSDMQHYQITVKFDDPVNVTPTFMFSAFRQRVTATIDIHGNSPARTGNGIPQLQLRAD